MRTAARPDQLANEARPHGNELLDLMEPIDPSIALMEPLEVFVPAEAQGLG